MVKVSACDWLLACPAAVLPSDTLAPVTSGDAVPVTPGVPVISSNPTFNFLGRVLTASPTNPNLPQSSPSSGGL